MTEFELEIHAHTTTVSPCGQGEPEELAVLYETRDMMGLLLQYQIYPKISG